MGCICSKGLTYHEDTWVYHGLTEENFKRALRETVPSRLPKYKIMDKDNKGNDPEDEHTIVLTRTTDMHGFIDDQTLKLSTNEKGDLIVFIHSASRVGLNDWGQNKRNCRQLKAGLDPVIKNLPAVDLSQIAVHTSEEKPSEKEEKKEKKSKKEKKEKKTADEEGTVSEGKNGSEEDSEED